MHTEWCVLRHQVAACKPLLTGPMRLAKYRKRKEHSPVAGFAIHHREAVSALLSCIPSSTLRADLLARFPITHLPLTLDLPADNNAGQTLLYRATDRGRHRHVSGRYQTPALI